jgi:3-oxoacyl-[acyl-carrier-protein] synthase-3
MKRQSSAGGLVYLHGVAHFHPPNIINNQFLTDLDISTTAEWIEDRLGILERRTVLDLDYIRHTRNADIRQAVEASQYSNPEMTEFAARLALKRARLDPQAIGLIVSGSSVPQYVAPPESFILGDRLGITPMCFELNAGCSTFLTQLSAISAMSAAVPEYILITQSENMTRYVDYNDRSGACLMGDCTTAAVISTKVPSPVVLRSISIDTIPNSWDTATIPATAHFSQKTTIVRGLAEKFLGEPSHFVVNGSPPPFLILHQTSPKLLASILDSVGVDPSRHLFNSDRYGNCASAGAVSVLSQNWDTLRSSGVPLTFVTIGAGFNWGKADFEFAPNEVPLPFLQEVAIDSVLGQAGAAKAGSLDGDANWAD